MKFTIEIGDAEKCRVEYSFNQLTGTLVIKVNQQPVKKSVRWLNEPQFEVHDLEVGEVERHVIRIEKVRKQLFGHRNKVFVDNRLVRVFDGN
jgi:hypothetical protein